MVPPRSQRRPPSSPSTRSAGSLRLENACPEDTRATVVLSTPADEPVAHLVRLENGESTGLPLPDEETTTVECHLDDGRGSAVLTVGADTDRPPVLRLQGSSVVVAR